MVPPTSGTKGPGGPPPLAPSAGGGKGPGWPRREPPPMSEEKGPGGPLRRGADLDEISDPTSRRPRAMRELWVGFRFKSSPPTLARGAVLKGKSDPT